MTRGIPGRDRGPARIPGQGSGQDQGAARPGAGSRGGAGRAGSPVPGECYIYSAKEGTV